MFSSSIQSPIGVISIKADEEYVYCISCKEQEPEEFPSSSALTDLAAKQLNEYFEGRRSSFDFPIAQQGTDFQQSVWQELLNIPPGYPISYAALSRRMGTPLAIRAIAAANGRNNLMIVVPCHRVIGSSGTLVGYAGGLWRKKWLLEHEARMMQIGQLNLL
ncbi:methylated-DNA--[protein]-cysteine S-methyltransferase [Arcticibacter tournemirensis]|uniref:Methylated-DNA--protein-cysteine methyltransferase n=1 Tax=Arcticibacter tournemirensis TaxID=699437 RepID=A0A4Q0MAH3_9SPHI|nr:methylated-DNA--[protein]-cysteine S-methyltransferase [Arcticibacter tournemirensis]KAA8484403.1 methylated-DNA--[protein]-cysteine S-methyltransferase [Arcticibacter tournemirensis]RXF69786.1 methylated-DNA--[protein]-cysteine S-methyltransferase [Arcticibacter tournemirensis]